MSRRIPLTKGKYALVDDADYDWLNQWKWCYVSSGYAMRRKYLGGGRKREKAQYILMHRLIADARDDKEVDHINHNRLDNRRNNLRLCNSGQNKRNSSLRKDNASGVKGVYWYKAYRKWTAQITVNGKSSSLGYFAKKDDAVKARKTAEAFMHGEFANVHL